MKLTLVGKDLYKKIGPPLQIRQNEPPAAMSTILPKPLVKLTKAYDMLTCCFDIGICPYSEFPQPNSSPLSKNK